MGEDSASYRSRLVVFFLARRCLIRDFRGVLRDVVSDLGEDQLLVRFFVDRFAIFFRLCFLLGLVFPYSFVLVTFVFSNLSF